MSALLEWYKGPQVTGVNVSVCIRPVIIVSIFSLVARSGRQSLRALEDHPFGQTLLRASPRPVADPGASPWHHPVRTSEGRGAHGKGG